MYLVRNLDSGDAFSTAVYKNTWRGRFHDGPPAGNHTIINSIISFNIRALSYL